MYYLQPASVQNSTVVLCWAVYQPYASLTPEEINASLNTSRQITLELKDGHGFKPVVLPFSAHTACYKVEKMCGVLSHGHTHADSSLKYLRRASLILCISIIKV